VVSWVQERNACRHCWAQINGSGTKCPPNHVKCHSYSSSNLWYGAEAPSFFMSVGAGHLLAVPRNQGVTCSLMIPAAPAPGLVASTQASPVPPHCVHDPHRYPHRSRIGRAPGTPRYRTGTDPTIAQMLGIILPILSFPGSPSALSSDHTTTAPHMQDRAFPALQSLADGDWSQPLICSMWLLVMSEPVSSLQLLFK